MQSGRATERQSLDAKAESRQRHDPTQVHSPSGSQALVTVSRDRETILHPWLTPSRPRSASNATGTCERDVRFRVRELHHQLSSQSASAASRRFLHQLRPTWSSVMMLTCGSTPVLSLSELSLWASARYQKLSATWRNFTNEHKAVCGTSGRSRSGSEATATTLICGRRTRGHISTQPIGRYSAGPANTFPQRFSNALWPSAELPCTLSPVAIAFHC